MLVSKPKFYLMSRIGIFISGVTISDSALITNDQLWKHCIGFKTGHGHKPSNMTYCKYYMRLLKTGMCYEYADGKAIFIRDNVFKMNTLLHNTYYIDKEGNLLRWDGQAESLIMTGVADCIALLSAVYILTFDGKLYEWTNDYLNKQVDCDTGMSIIHNDIKFMRYDEISDEIWLGTKDGIMELNGDITYYVNFMLTLDISGYEDYVYLYLHSNSNLTFETRLKKEFLLSGVAFVASWLDYLAIVITKDVLQIYKYSMLHTRRKIPICTVPDVRKIHHTTYTGQLMVLKTDGKLYHLSRRDDDNLDLVYISDKVIDMYSDHFIRTGYPA